MSCNQVLNLKFRQSTFFQKRFRLLDVNSLPLDLTGFTFFSQAKEQYADVTPAFEFTLTIRDQSLYPGEVDWTMEPAETDSLVITQETVYLYDVLMVQPDTEPICIFYGEIALTPKVTAVP